MASRLDPRWWGPIALLAGAVGLAVAWLSYDKFSTSYNTLPLPMRQGAKVQQVLRAHDPDGLYEVVLTFDQRQEFATNCGPDKSTPDAPDCRAPVLVKLDVMADGESIPILEGDGCCEFGGAEPGGLPSVSRELGRVRLPSFHRYQLKATVMSARPDLALLHPRLEVTPPPSEGWAVNNFMIFALSILMAAVASVWVVILLLMKLVSNGSAANRPLP